MLYRIGTAGSLNWTMETNEQALESLLLSLQLATRTLLSMENSARTRHAAVSHLRTFASYFYASDARYITQLKAMAAELGGTLEPPISAGSTHPCRRCSGRSLPRS